MASSSSKRRRSYDVFVNFRGKDVRDNFVSHLYRDLDRGGIYTYIDNEELKKGEQISTTLMEAIEESQMAIVVFSENYASSTWCLDELVKIMECKVERDLKVFPLFYKVDPREVRTPRASYKRDMDKHEDSGKVERWKKALFDAGNLSGLHFTGGNEAELVEQIVREISTRLDVMPLHVTKHPVGLDSRVRVLKMMLNLQSKDDVLVVGLWGQGGIGKTTLAKAVYNAIYREFQCSSFLEGVREKIKTFNGLVHLQKDLLSDVSLGKEFTIHSASRGIPMIGQRLCNKKALVILDDVDDGQQLEALVGNCESFGQGSRIIITTRNKQLLISHGIHQDHIYEVKVLQNNEALQLFRDHAFGGNQKVEISNKLVDMVLHYAGGLPLALEVLGSLLRGREKCIWERIMHNLSKYPDKRIKDVLRVSYDDLDEGAKEIFLDIACFFKDQSKEYIIKVLDSFDFGPANLVVQILIERSLIREGHHQTLQMHDLIQSMGKDIVKDECRNDPEMRSRLWLYDDVLNVLSTNSGTDKIRAIALWLPKREEMYIGSDAFINMRKLRLLILHNVQNSFVGVIHLPNGLRWLEWPHCTSTPEFGDGPKKIVGLDLWNTNIERILKKFEGFINLKFINFSECQSVICMPDLDCTPHLEDLNLSGCKNLEHAHKSIANHRKLKKLNLSRCSKLLYLSDVPKSKVFEILNLVGCSRLRRLPDNLDKAKSLRCLFLTGTLIEEIPATIKNLVSLEMMHLDDCKELVILPSSIYWLPKLKSLVLDGCSKLIKFPEKEKNLSEPHMKIGFPELVSLYLKDCNLSQAEFLENPSCFPRLQELYLGRNSFTSLPSCKHLNELSNLDVSCCPQLQEILGIPSRLRYLVANGCKSLNEIPTDIYQAEDIDFRGCQELANDEVIINNTFKLKYLCAKSDLLGSVFLPGGEMPDWLVPNNEDYISFIISKDLEEKFVGLAFCVVFHTKGDEATFHFHPAGDGTFGASYGGFVKVDSDHVWLGGFRKWWNRDEAFRSNDWGHFQFIIRASCGAIVKKCGFRLIWKPLGNDLEVLLQHNPWLQQDMFYQVGYEDSQTSLMEESLNERGYLLGSKTGTKASNLVLKASGEFSLEKFRYSKISPDYRNVLSGGDMPKEFIPIEDGTISFRASQDLYNKFLGLAICVVFSAKDGKNQTSFEIEPWLDDQKRNVLSGTLDSSDFDHIWIQYLQTNVLWGFMEGGVDFDQFDKKVIAFSLRIKISDGTVKKMGYVIRCRPLEDDLKAVLEDDQSLDLASLSEDSSNEADSHAHQFNRTEYLHRCHMHREERQPNDSGTDQRESGDNSSEED